MKMLLLAMLMVLSFATQTMARGPRGRDAVVPMRTSHYGVLRNSGYTRGIIADGWTQLQYQGFAVPSNDPSFLLYGNMPSYRAVEWSDGSVRIFRVR